MSRRWRRRRCPSRLPLYAIVALLAIALLLALPLRRADLPRQESADERWSQPRSRLPEAAFLLGPPHSGADLLAGLLELAGVQLRSDDSARREVASLERLKEDRGARDLYESAEVRQVNDALLKALNHTWISLCDFDAISALDRLSTLPREVDAAARAFVADAMERAQAARSSLWAVQEPRLSLTLPYWQHLLRPSTMHCVLVHRAPLEVAELLRRHNDVSIDAGIALWEAYYVAILNACRGKAVHVVSHKRLLKNPVYEAQTLVTALRHSHELLTRLSLNATLLESFARAYADAEAAEGATEHIDAAADARGSGMARHRAVRRSRRKAEAEAEQVGAWPSAALLHDLLDAHSSHDTARQLGVHRRSSGAHSGRGLEVSRQAREELCRIVVDVRRGSPR